MELDAEDRHNMALARNSMEIEGYYVSDEVLEKAGRMAKGRWESGETERCLEDSENRFQEKQAQRTPGKSQ